jgi:hypothetical protein
LLGDFQSPILGGRAPPSVKHSLAVNRETAEDIVQSAFQSEDSDILAHNGAIQGRLIPTTPPKQPAKHVKSTYTWSPSQAPPTPKGASSPISSAPFVGLGLIIENVYERRPRRKMVLDPVTGITNTNPKQPKSKTKPTKKVSRPDKFLDLRPLDRFESKLIAKDRLSVFPPTSAPQRLPYKVIDGSSMLRERRGEEV